VLVLTVSVFLLGYIYVGYPLLMAGLALIRRRPVQKGPFSGGVSVLIAAHNEKEALPRKVKALLELAQKEPIREICLGLDGCTDGTGDRVREAIEGSLETGDRGQETGWRGEYPIFKGAPGLESKAIPALHILEFEEQRGKAAVLNDLMGKATHPIFVMMDARQRAEPGCIDRLVENFADPQVGVVSGALMYEAAEGSAQKGADSYWDYEKQLRLNESRFGSVPGATGALYAIRKELCRPIPENTLVDDVLIPMRAVLMGFRCLFEPSARVFDLPSVNFIQENIRKRRTLAGIWQCWSIEPKIFSVLANPIWFQWISHKFLRLLTPYLCLMAYLSLGFLAWGGIWGWKVIFSGALLGLMVSFFAYFSGGKSSSRWLGILGAIFGLNLSLIQASMDAWTGRFDSQWKS